MPAAVAEEAEEEDEDEPGEGCPKNFECNDQLSPIVR